MNTHIYAEVFKFRGDDPYEKRVNETKFGFNRAIQAFRRDLAGGKVAWTGQFWKDFEYYIACEHPLVSVFKAPRIHPFSPKERIVVLAITSSLAGVLSIITKFIQDALHTGDPWIDIAIPRLIPIVGGIGLLFIGTFLKIFATCGCVQNTDPKIRDFCEEIGAYLLGISVFITVVIATVGIYFTYLDGTIIAFLISFGTSMASSWITAFIKLYIAFRVYWKLQMSKDMNKISFIVSYHDYQDVIAMRRLRRTNYPGLEKFEQRRSLALVLGKTAEQRRMSRRRSSYVPENVLKIMSPRTLKDLEAARIQQSCVLEINPIDKQAMEATSYNMEILHDIRRDSVIKAAPVFDQMMSEIEVFEQKIIKTGYDEGGLLVTKDKRDQSKRRQSIIGVSLGRANSIQLNQLAEEDLTETESDSEDDDLPQRAQDIQPHVVHAVPCPEPSVMHQPVIQHVQPMIPQHIIVNHHSPWPPSTSHHVGMSIQANRVHPLPQQHLVPIFIK